MLSLAGSWFTRRIIIFENRQKGKRNIYIEENLIDILNKVKDKNGWIIEKGEYMLDYNIELPFVEDSS